MDGFPVFLKLSQRKVLLAGGGSAALAKLRLLQGAGARVRVVAKAIAPEMSALVLSGGGEFRSGSLEAADFEGVDLVFAANEDEALDRAVFEAARAAGKFVNAVDRPTLSDFTMPAIVDRGNVVIAVSTEGASPVLAQRVRAAIEGVLPARLGRLADFARRFRAAVAAHVAAGRERRAFWSRVFDGPIGQAVLAGDEAGAARDLIRLLNGERRAQGSGHVWLVGAGPGDPELLTLKAARLLREADVVVHDRLVDPAILDIARRDARRVFVGKSKGEHAMTQREINNLLIVEARLGNKVVRLKGGDPMIFGRGGEEAEALSEAGISFETVPGITAALGCAASAGIPLTHRDHASRLVLVSGHDRSGIRRLDWKGMADADQTLVVYMGVSAALSIGADLIAGGLPAATPVAIIENGTRWNQRVVRGRLSDLAALVRAHGIVGPALMVIGSVAGLADERLSATLAGAAE